MKKETPIKFNRAELKLAKDLHAIALVAIRKDEGYNNGNGWRTASRRTHIGMRAIAQHILKTNQ